MKICLLCILTLATLHYFHNSNTEACAALDIERNELRIPRPVQEYINLNKNKFNEFLVNGSSPTKIPLSPEMVSRLAKLRYSKEPQIKAIVGTFFNGNSRELLLADTDAPETTPADRIFELKTTVQQPAIFATTGSRPVEPAPRKTEPTAGPGGDMFTGGCEESNCLEPPYKPNQQTIKSQPSDAYANQFGPAPNQKSYPLPVKQPQSYNLIDPRIRDYQKRF